MIIIFIDLREAPVAVIDRRESYRLNVAEIYRREAVMRGRFRTRITMSFYFLMISFKAHSRPYA